MSVTMVEVRVRRDLRSFVHFPFRLYHGCPYWVLRFCATNTPHCVGTRTLPSRTVRPGTGLAYKGGHSGGQDCRHHQHAYVTKWNEPRARFGWVDFIDDREVSGQLFRTVEDWARSEGMSSIHGPSGHGHGREGCSSRALTSSPRWQQLQLFVLPRHTEALGYVKDTDWLEFEIKVLIPSREGTQDR